MSRSFTIKTAGDRMKMQGKTVLNHTYWHHSLTSQQPISAQEKVTIAEQLANLIAGDDYTVVKFNHDGETLSLLNYPDFFDNPFPELKTSWHIDLKNGRVEKRRYAQSINPPILHRKEQLLPANYSTRKNGEALTQIAEQLGLFDDTKTIGFKQAWENLIAAKGFQLIGNEFVPLANVETNDSETVEFSNDTKIARHLTALSRSNLSAPIQCLARHGFLNAERSVFDYGCGKGDDIRNLLANDICAAGWDPHYAPENPKQPADCVNLGFVINVIENYDERLTALTSAFELATQLLVVSAMLINQNTFNGERLNDGVRTQRNTFQKYYTQSELKDFLSDTLDVDAIPVAPGIFFIFKDRDEEQRFLLNRQRSYRNVSRVAYRKPNPVLPRLSRDEQKFLASQHLLQPLWQQTLDFGRLPEKSEITNLVELTSAFGTISKALQFMLSHFDESLLQQARQNRIDDLLTYFALQTFSQRRAYKHLEDFLQRDIKAFLGDYKNAIAAAQTLLFQISNVEAITLQCKQAAELGLGFLDSESALLMHTSLIERLPALLRIYIGCATVLYGDIEQADLIKIHSNSGKLSVLRYDDFENQPLPRLLERIKINLKDQLFDVFQYGDEYEPPFLYLKSNYINEEFTNYAQQLAFDEQLQALNLFDLTGYGLKPSVFHKILENARWDIVDFELVRSQTIPKLDAPCGHYLTYRQLIECGQTQQQSGLANLPKQPDSYTALYELAKNILDPVIEYFGMVQLSYGFCSHDLGKLIKKSVAPKLDQHAAHELNTKKNPICERLGAAVDFVIEDENMREVADWIAENLPFDRLYFYGENRSIHVSYGNEHKREYVDLVVTESGRQVPKRRKI